MTKKLYAKDFDEETIINRSDIKKRLSSECEFNNENEIDYLFEYTNLTWAKITNEIFSRVNGEYRKSLALFYNHGIYQKVIATNIDFFENNKEDNFEVMITYNQETKEFIYEILEIGRVIFVAYSKINNAL